MHTTKLKTYRKIPKERPGRLNDERQIEEGVQKRGSVWMEGVYRRGNKRENFGL